jgi:hypothetical protein
MGGSIPSSPNHALHDGVPWSTNVTPSAASRFALGSQMPARQHVQGFDTPPLVGFNPWRINFRVGTAF